MKKILTIILCIAMVFTFATGCGQNTKPADEPTDQQTETAEDQGQDVQEPDEPETPEAPEETAQPEEPEYKFTFDPKAVSGYWKEIFGESMVDTWYNVVDAALKGEDTFECPDEDTLGWVMGQFPEKCFPVLGELIAPAYGSAENGTGKLIYLTSREEFDEKVSKFTAQVEDILNETMKEEYTDMEKALSLYRYFCTHYEYDYETYEGMYYEPQDQVRCYRLFEEGIGICQELSTAYSFLLTQAGVDATIMMGGDHAWSYVRINGNNYHIDPTFVLGEPVNMAYFMMTDGQRRYTYSDDGEWTIGSVFVHEHEHPEYEEFVADDDFFKDIWDTTLVDFDHDKHVIHCTSIFDEEGDIEFDYEGF